MPLVISYWPVQALFSRIVVPHPICLMAKHASSSHSTRVYGLSGQSLRALTALSKLEFQLALLEVAARVLHPSLNCRISNGWISPPTHSSHRLSPMSLPVKSGQLHGQEKAWNAILGPAKKTDHQGLLMYVESMSSITWGVYYRLNTPVLPSPPHSQRPGVSWCPGSMQFTVHT